MIIKKILNNNVAITDNENGIEQVVCGRGIAFKKKPGDEIDGSQINQIFVLKNEIQNAHFQQIIANIPIDYIELADEVVEFIKMHIGQKINDSIYITLSDHLFTAIERAKEGIDMPNTMLWEIRSYYESEYAIAKRVLNIVKERTGVELKDDEAGFIALHIVNSETEGAQLEETMKITEIVKEIAKIVRLYFNKEFDTESVYFFRFVTHLKFFAQRVVYHKTFEGNQDNDLYEVIRNKYPNSDECVERIAKMMLKNYDYRISNEEKLYLIIHVHRIVHIDDGND